MSNTGSDPPPRTGQGDRIRQQTQRRFSEDDSSVTPCPLTRASLHVTVRCTDGEHPTKRLHLGQTTVTARRTDGEGGTRNVGLRASQRRRLAIGLLRNNLTPGDYDVSITPAGPHHNLYVVVENTARTNCPGGGMAYIPQISHAVSR